MLNGVIERMSGQSDDRAESPRLEILDAVAGAGKTAFSHSLAERCYDSGYLGSAFFFDREQPERSRLVFITMAQDLAGKDPRVGAHIRDAIQKEPGLITASLGHQFRKLILEPCRRFPPSHKTVMLIDALDESFDGDDGRFDALFDVLRDDVPELPPSFHVFATSRDSTHLRRLKKAPHVRSMTLNIRDASNLDDIAAYVRHELDRISAAHDFGHSWPGESFVEQLIKKAEGHFQWVATVAKFLTNPRTFDPEAKLQTLLSVTDEVLPPERKMDKLYAHILSGYDWEDANFVESYQSFMGSLLTLRSPLTPRALQSLHANGHRQFKIKAIADLVSPLLTGWPDANEPIQILHQSLRDFLTRRAQNEAEWKKFYIDEKRHDERLAVLALSSLIDKMSSDIPCAGFIDAGELDMSEMAKFDIPEEVLYSCRFWTSHIVGVNLPTESLVELLRQLLSSKFVLWMEVTSCTGNFQSLAAIREWVKVCFIPQNVQPNSNSIVFRQRSLVMMKF